MRVIIVDDESDILEDIKETILNYSDFEIVGTYINPLAALEDSLRTNPDCAFLDIEMPGMSGIDLAERLLTRKPDMDIVFITAFNHYATQAFEVNAMDYILKPIHPKRFEKTMERLLNNKDKPNQREGMQIWLRTFGAFELLLDGKAVKWNRSKAKELLAYLLHYESQRKSKYKICEDLWPEYEPKKALVNLQTAMCSLRKSLGYAGQADIRIEFSEESYVLYPGDIKWDVKEFIKLYDTVKTKGDINCAKEAVSLYRSDYLGDEDWVWSQLTAESMARKYEELLEIIAVKSYHDRSYSDTVEVIMNLAQRQAVDGKLQLMLAQAAYAGSGSTGLRQQITMFQGIYNREYDMDLEPEVIEFCAQKGIKT